MTTFDDKQRHINKEQSELMSELLNFLTPELLKK